VDFVLGHFVVAKRVSVCKLGEHVTSYLQIDAKILAPLKKSREDIKIHKSLDLTAKGQNFSKNSSLE
jgi:hypothetical protein